MYLASHFTQLKHTYSLEVAGDCHATRSSFLISGEGRSSRNRGLSQSSYMSLEKGRFLYLKVHTRI